MVHVKKYNLPPTPLMPNSPKPLLHYPGLFKEEDLTASNVFETFRENGWQTKWIFRYGPTQKSHYHSAAHEAMVVLSGSAKILFGVADLEGGAESEQEQEEGGVLLDARAGDVFVLPAGTAHKTHDVEPDAGFGRLSPGDGHTVDEGEMRAALRTVRLDGFTMMGAYPVEGGDWDFAVGGDSRGRYEEVWSVPNPGLDPVLGDSGDGVCGQWR